MLFPDLKFQGKNSVHRTGIFYKEEHMKRTIAVIVLIMMTLTLVSTVFAGGNKEDAAPAKEAEAAPTKDAAEENMLLIALPEPTGDKWAGMWGDVGALPRVLMFRRLLRLNTDLEPVIYDLATKYTVSDDSKTYTFTLRDDVVWHDGVKFTPEDVAWSLHMAMKATSIQGIASSNFAKIKGAQDFIDGKADSASGISTSGNTITIKLVDPSSTFLMVMAQWMPYPKHLLKDEPPETLHIADFWEMPVGNGPFEVTEFIAGEYAILERFDDFYGAKPKIEKIKCGNILEGDYITYSQAGEIDFFMTRSLEIVKEVEKLADYTVYPVDILYLRYFMFNLQGYGGKTDGNTLVNDIKVREAILHAIDRQSITDQLFPGQGEVLNTLVPTGLAEYNKSAKTYEYNPEKAKQLLKEANFDFSKTLRVVDYYGDQQTSDLMDTVIYYLGEVGINAEHYTLKGDLGSLIYDQREYDMVYAGWAPTTIDEIYANQRGNNVSMGRLRPMGDNKFDPLIRELNQTTDMARRREIIKELQAAEEDYLWYGYLFSLKNYIAVNTSRLNHSGKFGHEWTNYDREFEKWELK